MDMIRTRHVLRQVNTDVSFVNTAANIFRTEGLAKFWVGVLPRCCYMFMGGLVYLGTYNYCCTTLSKVII